MKWPVPRLARAWQWIDRVVEAARTGGESTIAKVRAEVKELMDGYPAPGLPVG
ncbi:hypothetical protein [Streptomyces sp. NPDC001933]|uniref:hypothetical protein n=1 Tax=Streptomyces sp. NPDC001933 TaxID=3364626 RepID=UPI003695C668